MSKVQWIAGTNPYRELCHNMTAGFIKLLFLLLYVDMSWCCCCQWPLDLWGSNPASLSIINKSRSNNVVQFLLYAWPLSLLDTNLQDSFQGFKPYQGKIQDTGCYMCSRPQLHQKFQDVITECSHNDRGNCNSSWDKCTLPWAWWARF